MTVLLHRPDRQQHDRVFLDQPPPVLVGGHLPHRHRSCHRRTLLLMWDCAKACVRYQSNTPLTGMSHRPVEPDLGEVATPSPVVWQDRGVNQRRRSTMAKHGSRRSLSQAWLEKSVNASVPAIGRMAAAIDRPRSGKRPAGKPATASPRKIWPMVEPAARTGEDEG